MPRAPKHTTVTDLFSQLRISTDADGTLVLTSIADGRETDVFVLATPANREEEETALYSLGRLVQRALCVRGYDSDLGESVNGEDD